MAPSSSDAPAGVTETVRAIASGEVTAARATAEALARMAGDDLNAISVTLSDAATAEAAARDAQTGPRGPLHGVPLVIKEEVDVAGAVTTFGGLGNSTPQASDAELV